MYRVSKTETGKRIRKLMLKRGITVREVQEAMELESPQSVYKWMNGKAIPTIENLFILGKMLNVPIEAIVVLEETEPEPEEEWKRKHPPAAIDCYFGVSEQVRKADAKRFCTIVENMAQDRLRTVSDRDQSSKSS